MFESLKDFINSRLGSGMVEKDLVSVNGHFIYIDIPNLYSVLFFLKNDPDLKLILFDQLFALARNNPDAFELEIYYQLKSLKLPYRVTVVLTIKDTSLTIPSISSIFSGARWQEQDLENRYNLTIT